MLTARQSTLIWKTTISLERATMTERNPLHPGEILQDSLAEVGWTAQEFADKLGVNRSDVVQLLDGNGRISPTIAKALERIGWSNADFWLRLQAGHDRAVSRRAKAAKA